MCGVLWWGSVIPWERLRPTQPDIGTTPCQKRPSRKCEPEGWAGIRQRWGCGKVGPEERVRRVSARESNTLSKNGTRVCWSWKLHQEQVMRALGNSLEIYPLNVGERIKIVSSGTGRFSFQRKGSPYQAGKPRGRNSGQHGYCSNEGKRRKCLRDGER